MFGIMPVEMVHDLFLLAVPSFGWSRWSSSYDFSNMHVCIVMIAPPKLKPTPFPSDVRHNQVAGVCWDIDASLRRLFVSAGPRPSP
jgi:hypothetical protein